MEKKIKNSTITAIFILIACILLLFIKQIAEYKDFINTLKWYLILILLTISALPITTIIFQNFKDKGYIFSKTIGILLSGYIMWILSSFHIMKFNFINSIICTLVVLVFSLIIYKKKEKTTISKKDTLTFFRIELVFLIIFLFCSYIKGFNPNIDSTEKYMDYGYMAIIDKTDYMPPQDLWFAKEKINYYYFGQYISSFITKLSNVKVEYGYNLMLITLFTITALSSFSIVYNLLLNKTKNKKIPYIGGIIASLANTIAGNMHYVIYNLIIPFINKNKPGYINNYYFPNSTRYIGYNPITNDKTIHEFPSYSFILGDLHAHVINIIFVLLLISLLLIHITNNKKDKTQIPIMLLIGFLLSIYKMTNYWDFIIYLTVTVLIIIITNIINLKRIKEIIKLSLKQLSIIFISSFLISLPFTLIFNKMILGVKTTTNHTPIYQLIVLWGLPITILLYYIIITIIKTKPPKNKKNIILKYLYKISKEDIFMIILGICALGLIIIPEIVYVVDIYTTMPRANTMFKLTYQSYILLGLGFGYYIINIIINKKKYNKIIGIIFLVLFTLTIGYTLTATKSWFGDIKNTNNYKTLNGKKYLENSLIIYKLPEYEKEYCNQGATTKDDLNMINWLNKNTNKNDIIIETYGDSYTNYNRISTFTGLATPMGWETHEWLWRTTDNINSIPESVFERMSEVELFYTSQNIKELKRIIKKYDIKYIIIGYNERIKYTEGDNKLLNEDILNELGSVAYETNTNNLKNKSYIIRVKSN